MDSQEGASHHHNIYQRKKYKLYFFTINFTLSILTSSSVMRLARVLRTQTLMIIRHMSLQLVKQTKPGQSPPFHINVNVSKKIL